MVLGVWLRPYAPHYQRRRFYYAAMVLCDIKLFGLFSWPATQLPNESHMEAYSYKCLALVWLVSRQLFLNFPNYLLPLGFSSSFLCLTFLLTPWLAGDPVAGACRPSLTVLIAPHCLLLVSPSIYPILAPYKFLHISHIYLKMVIIWKMCVHQNKKFYKFNMVFIFIHYIQFQTISHRIANLNNWW